MSAESVRFEERDSAGGSKKSSQPATRLLGACTSGFQKQDRRNKKPQQKAALFIGLQRFHKSITLSTYLNLG